MQGSERSLRSDVAEQGGPSSGCRDSRHTLPSVSLIFFLPFPIAVSLVSGSDLLKVRRESRPPIETNQRSPPSAAWLSSHSLTLSYTESQVETSFPLPHLYPCLAHHSMHVSDLQMPDPCATRGSGSGCGVASSEPGGLGEGASTKGEPGGGGSSVSSEGPFSPSLSGVSLTSSDADVELDLDLDLGTDVIGDGDGDASSGSPSKSLRTFWLAHGNTVHLDRVHRIQQEEEEESRSSSGARGGGAVPNLTHFKDHRRGDSDGWQGESCASVIIAPTPSITGVYEDGRHVGHVLRENGQLALDDSDRRRKEWLRGQPVSYIKPLTSAHLQDKDDLVLACGRGRVEADAFQVRLPRLPQSVSPACGVI